jgi:hypothetical protein
MMRRALPALLFLAATAAAPAERYVPAEGWRDARDAELFERWFGGQLRAMGEPVLSRAGGIEGYRRRFRMLVVPTFQPAYAVRIDEGAHGGTVRVVLLDGRGGYAPGRIARQATFTLTMAEVQDVIGAIRTSGLASAALEDPPDPPQVITVCADGTAVVFELIEPQRSRFVVRACGISGPLWRLGNRMARFYERMQTGARP